MLTAKTSIPSTNWPSGYLLYTNASGVKSTIIDIEPIPYDSSVEYNVEIIEEYPSGTPPTLTHTSTGILMTTRNNFPVTNTRIYCASNRGSRVKVRASGQCEVVVNYINVDTDIGGWAGFYAGNERGVL